MQRVSALALIPLALWFTFSIVALSGSGYGTTRAWFRAPFDFGLTGLLLIATFYHAALGLKVVIEDYVHQPMLKHGLIVAANFACIALSCAGVVALLRIALGQ